ncbi:sulfur carrier protein ThiS [Saccharibacter sp. 17.LH.SD]|uniref:sulfur carrier protein ThiS n=1 Tax=Saccharibacter sp. 17.LH.SD TaxID=2689393 RepID=UPI00136F47FB|nr:sulfur carrier protein ThiS [Saccharibacter sp. 17.LH.SD]MXV44463.1 sulfur carrier protein ThiS [Saccharibacter sp. 17.LH.SD]
MTQLKVNGEWHPFSETLGALIKDLALDQASVATALNGQFVPAVKRDDTVLHAGDEVEVLAPMQGG